MERRLDDLECEIARLEDLLEDLRVEAEEVRQEVAQEEEERRRPFTRCNTGSYPYEY